jgi:hypothetical protein
MQQIKKADAEEADAEEAEAVVSLDDPKKSN